MSFTKFQPAPWVTRLRAIIGGTGRGWLALGLTCLALALSGCSAARLGYGAAPELMYLWLDSYLDFDNAQARRVKTELKTMHRWHRSEEMPLLADLLQ